VRETIPVQLTEKSRLCGPDGSGSTPESISTQNSLHIGILIDCDLTRYIVPDESKSSVGEYTPL